MDFCVSVMEFAELITCAARVRNTDVSNLLEKSFALWVMPSGMT
jgi:hypothetical protein